MTDGVIPVGRVSTMVSSGVEEGCSRTERRIPVLTARLAMRRIPIIAMRGFIVLSIAGMRCWAKPGYMLEYSY